MPNELPEGWTTDGDYVVAPIRWNDAGPYVEVDTLIAWVTLGACAGSTRYMVVGYFRLDTVGDTKMKPYPCLGKWQATHVAMLPMEG